MTNCTRCGDEWNPQIQSVRKLIKMSSRISVYYDGYLHIFRDCNEGDKFFYSICGIEKEFKASEQVLILMSLKPVFTDESNNHD